MQAHMRLAAAAEAAAASGSGGEAGMSIEELEELMAGQQEDAAGAARHQVGPALLAMSSVN